MRLPWPALRSRYASYEEQDNELRIDVSTPGEMRQQRVRLTVHPTAECSVVRVRSTALKQDRALDVFSKQLRKRRKRRNQTAMEEGDGTTSTQSDDTAGTPMVRWLELLRHNDHIRDVALQLNGQHLEVYEDIVLFGDSVSIERLIPTIERVAKFADRLERRVHGGDDF